MANADLLLRFSISRSIAEARGLTAIRTRPDTSRWDRGDTVPVFFREFPVLHDFVAGDLLEILPIFDNIVHPSGDNAFSGVLSKASSNQRSFFYEVKEKFRVRFLRGSIIFVESDVGISISRSPRLDTCVPGSLVGGSIG